MLTQARVASALSTCTVTTRLKSRLGHLPCWLSFVSVLVICSLRTGPVSGDDPPASLTAATTSTASDEPGDEASPGEKAASPKTEAQVEKEFRKRLFPLLTDNEKGCVDCHSTAGTSALVLSGNALDDFRLLLDEQYLKVKGADTLLNRVTTDHVERRMPKEAQAWGPQEIKQLKRFLHSVEQLEEASGKSVDEQFPRSLRSEYRGERNTQTDNQFLSYRQLRGKIQVLFEDDWVRDGRDLFAENVAMFGGADFKTRFDETTQPSASFLTALESMSRDVAMMAYNQQRGPFKNWPEPEERPQTDQPDAAYTAAIEHLYEHILFRPATAAETSEALALIRSVFELETTIAQRDDELRFELTVSDPQSGLTRKQEVRIPVSGDLLQVRQLIVNQATQGEPGTAPSDPTADATDDRPDKDSAKKSESSMRSHFKPDKNAKLARRTLATHFWLDPNASGQRLVLHNLGTARNVSFAGVEILDSATGKQLRSIAADSPEVEVEGAWQTEDDDGLESFEDRNLHKGKSLIRVPLNVEQAGEVDIVLRWRLSDRNAPNVLVELFGARAGNELAASTTPAIPPIGQARFVYDSSDDTVAFFTPPASFRFDDESAVRISNEGTLDQVTAGAVEFAQSSNPERTFVIDSLEAEGHKAWQRFDEGRFKAYNVKGAKLHDDNDNKGELSLVYRPNDRRGGARDADDEDPANGAGENDRQRNDQEAKPEVAKKEKSQKESSQKPGSKKPGSQKPGSKKSGTAKDSGDQEQQAAWQPAEFYDLKIYYPGKRDQDSQVPVTIIASKSTPIVQIAHPSIAKAEGRVRLDASASYTVDHAPLKFQWRQTSGSRIVLGDRNSPVLEFVAPRRRAEQAAWTALCAALMRHPDFLFTRPTSLFHCEQPAVKQRLQLVKLALDLVGRPPTREELSELAGGCSLAEMTDRYLASQEFRDFYYHRIRLNLESQATEVQDEPVRLWCYVAFNGRPFQEILTADYTVDTELHKVERPAYHGKTGILTTAGFIQGKPGLPHYNYAAQVSMLFLGFVYEVPAEIVELREGVTALGTTDPNSVCYSCHKILTPLAFQRLNWTDDGEFRTKDEYGMPIDASDHGASADYPFAGVGLEAFATQAVRKERFLRTMINTHVNFFFGRPLRHREDERELYRRLWEHTHATDFQIIELIRAIVTSPEYLEGRSAL